MKKIIFLFIAGFATIITNAQEVKYKILKDDPYDIKPNAISIDPFYADCWFTDINMGLGLRADAMFKKLLTFHMDLRKAYLDIGAHENAFDKSLPKPKDKVKKHLYFELGGELSFIDRAVSKQMKVVLSSYTTTSGNYQTTHTKFIMVPGTLRKVKQLRGGLSIARAGIAIENTPNEGATFTATKVGDPNTTFTFGDYGATVDNSSVYNGYTNMNLAILHAGIGFKWITNLIVDTDYSKKGKRSNSGIYELYADALFAPVISFNDVYTMGGAQWELSTTEKKRTGWRVGIAQRSSSSSFFSYKTEFGSRPGYKGSELTKGSLYLMVTIGWSIPINAKFLNAKSE